MYGWKATVILLLLLGGATLAQEGDKAKDEKPAEEKAPEETAPEERPTEERADDEVDNSLEDEIEDYTEGSDGLGLNIVIRSGNVRGALQIFGDVGFVYLDPPRAGRANSNFFNGSLDIFFTARVGDHFHVLSETVFQAFRKSASRAFSSRLAPSL